MTERLARIISELNALQSSDFNLNNVNSYGLERLDKLTHELVTNATPVIAAKTLLEFIERLSRSPEIDPRYDLGTPGIIVHTLEEIPGYEKHLFDSLNRYPTPLTVCMVNRILNTDINQDKKKFWLGVLKSIINDINVVEITKEEAQQFLTYQLTREAS